MDKQCIRIEIESHTGYFHHPHKMYKLVLTREGYSVECEITPDFIEEFEVSIFPVTHKFELKDVEQIEKLFDFASAVKFNDCYPDVLDGPSVAATLIYDKGNNKRTYAIYGWGINESYGSLFELLKLIEPLIGLEKEELTYLNFEEPNI